MDSKLNSALCKEIVTPLIDLLAFLGFISSELNQYRGDYLKNRLPENMSPFAKNVPAKLQSLFRNDPNKRIRTIGTTNTALTARIRQYDK